MSRLRVPVSYRGIDYTVLNTGVYLDGKVYCHLSRTDNPPHQVGVFLPVEDVFSLDNPDLLKILADLLKNMEGSNYSDAICIPWSLLYQEGYSEKMVLATVRQGIEIGVFRYRYCHSEPRTGQPQYLTWTGEQPLYLNTRPGKQEYVA